MESSDSLVILFIFDSVRADILYNLINTNQMPYLRKYIFNRAAIVENCFTTFPTNTIPGHLAILTGTYSNKHHVPAMRMWNLSKMRYRDYSGLEIFNLLSQEFNPNVKMVYDFFPYSEAFTSSNFAKGAKYVYLNKSRMIFYYLLQKLNYRVVLIQSLKTFLRHLRKKPTDALYVLWLPITDVLSHEKGPDSPEFFRHFQEIDQMLFRVLFEGYKNWKGLIKLQLLNRSYFIITADHGSFVIQQKSELIHEFKSLPLQIKDKQVSPKISILLAYTDGFASLYVKHPLTKRWKDRVTYDHLIAYPTSNGPINLIEFILKIPTVSHLFVIKEGIKPFSYLVFSQEGTSEIQRKVEDDEIQLSYKVIRGKDPFAYNNSPDAKLLLDGSFHPTHEWLKALRRTNYPLMVDQIPRLFDCDNLGDILFMGKEGSSFSRKKNYRGTHDTGTYNCLRVPLILAGPNIKHTIIPTARTVDIVPTLLYLLQKKVNFKQFDGKILSEIIQS